jgi:hypothetical protein
MSQPVDGTLITYHNGLPSSGHGPFRDQNDDAPSDSQDTNMLKRNGKLREAPTQLQAIEALKQLGRYCAHLRNPVEDTRTLELILSSEYVWRGCRGC